MGRFHCTCIINPPSFSPCSHSGCSWKLKAMFCSASYILQLIHYDLVHESISALIFSQEQFGAQLCVGKPPEGSECVSVHHLRVPSCYALLTLPFNCV